MTAHCRPVERFEFGPKSIELAKFIIDRRHRGDSTMAVFEAVGQEWPDLSFRDYWGAHALADCIERDPTLRMTGAAARYLAVEARFPGGRVNTPPFPQKTRRLAAQAQFPGTREAVLKLAASFSPPERSRSASTRR
jgi:hypothetical protein